MILDKSAFHVKQKGYLCEDQQEMHLFDIFVTFKRVIWKFNLDVSRLESNFRKLAKGIFTYK